MRISEASDNPTEELYRSLIEGVKDYGVFLLDPQGNVASWNPGAQRLFGYEESEILGRHFSLFFTPEQLREKAPEKELQEARREGKASDDRWQVRKDGTWFFVSGITRALGPRGNRGFAKVTRDLTAEKRAEVEKQRLAQEIENERARLDAVIRQMPAAVLLADAPSGRLVMGNEFVDKFLRHPFIPAASIDEYGKYKAFHPDGRPYEPAEWPLARSVTLGEVIVDEQMNYLRGDGTQAVLLFSSAPIRDRGGKIIAAVAAINDFTERKRGEEERALLLEREQVARRQAEQAMRVRDEFLGTVSHELRTPLTAILLWTRILRTGRLSENEWSEALETVDRSARAQSELIEDLLDVSRLMTGKLHLEIAEIDLRPVIQAACEAVRPMAEIKGVQLRSQLDADVGLVLADASRIQQVVWNLLTNAVKFTDEGGTIEVRLSRDDGMARIEVSDTGHGVPPDFLPYVFDRFRQAETGTRRTHGGLGLGLAIVKQFVELHGGKVHAESVGEGKGARFVVELPRSRGVGDGSGRAPMRPPAAAVAAPLEPSTLLQGVRILLVEDEGDTRKVLAWLLERAKAEVISVPSVAEAMKALKEQRWPDVIVSDIGMAGQDGYQLIEQVRRREADLKRPATPAIALTAYTREADQKRALAAGFQIHLGKPPDPERLLASVAHFVGRMDGADHPSGHQS